MWRCNLENIKGIDSTFLSNESGFLLLDRFKTEINHLKSEKIPCYKRLNELGLDNDCTIIELFDALPSNCHAQLELSRENINLSTKLFKKNSNVVPAILVVTKGVLRADFSLITEHGELHRYIYGSNKYDTGWTGIRSERLIWVDSAFVSSLEDFIYTGSYYIPRGTSSNIAGFPSNWDCFLKVESYSNTHKMYTVNNLTTNLESWVKIVAPTVESEWKKVR